MATKPISNERLFIVINCRLRKKRKTVPHTQFVRQTKLVVQVVYVLFKLFDKEKKRKTVPKLPFLTRKHPFLGPFFQKKN